MNSLSIILTFLGWEPKQQLLCLPGLPTDSGSPDFSFGTDNFALRAAKIVRDLHYQREGETLIALRDRRGIPPSLNENNLMNLEDVLEGLNVLFDLMSRSSKGSLFTCHGIQKAAAWRFIRRLAREGQRYLPTFEEPSEPFVTSFLETYQFDE